MILKCLLCVVDSHYNTSLFKEPRQRENSPTSVPHKVYRICTWGSVVRIWKLICSWGFPNLLMVALWSRTYQYLNPTHLERLLGIYRDPMTWAAMTTRNNHHQKPTMFTQSLGQNCTIDASKVLPSSCTCCLSLESQSCSQSCRCGD